MSVLGLKGFIRSFTVAMFYNGQFSLVASLCCVLNKMRWLVHMLGSDLHCESAPGGASVVVFSVQACHTGNS